MDLLHSFFYKKWNKWSWTCSIVELLCVDGCFVGTFGRLMTVGGVTFMCGHRDCVIVYTVWRMRCSSCSCKQKLADVLLYLVLLQLTTRRQFIMQYLTLFWRVRHSQSWERSLSFLCLLFTCIAWDVHCSVSRSSSQLLLNVLKMALHGTDVL